jgi:NADH-quinone oxidoreductase subunit J
LASVLGFPLQIGLLGILSYVIYRMLPRSADVKFGGFTGGTARDVGRALFTEYLLPFEVTSVLVLIAILGAIVLARKEMD